MTIPHELAPYAIGAVVDNFLIVREPHQGKEYKALINVVHPSTGKPTYLCFPLYTADVVCRVIAQLYTSRARVKVHYGNTNTGKDSHYTLDTTGYIGVTTGWLRSPILVYNSRAMGGGLLDADAIVKITDTRKPYQEYYTHPTYHE